jgi:hypothetical protein
MTSPRRLQAPAPLTQMSRQPITTARPGASSPCVRPAPFTRAIRRSPMTAAVAAGAFLAVATAALHAPTGATS